MPGIGNLCEQRAGIEIGPHQIVQTRGADYARDGSAGSEASRFFVGDGLIDAGTEVLLAGGAEVSMAEQGVYPLNAGEGQLLARSGTERFEVSVGHAEKWLPGLHRLPFAHEDVGDLAGHGGSDNGQAHRFQQKPG